MEPSDLLRTFVEAVERLGLRYAVTGSMATIAFGEPRFTNDIDVIVELPLDKVKPLCDSFPAPEFYVSHTAARQSVIDQRQFNVIHPGSGFKVDIIIAKRDRFDSSRLSRAIRLKVDEDLEVFFSTPEDVIVKKLEFFRMGGSDKHVRDITGVLKHKGGQLDYHYLEEWTRELGLEEIWKSILNQHHDPN